MYKIAFVLCLGLVLTNTSNSQAQSYDSTYAAQLGADDYGMKTYVMAFLKTGPNRSSDPEVRKKLQQGHMDNIMRMAENGDLLMAGPFLDTGSLRGIYIFNVRTLEEARKLTETDPAIQAGSLVMELKKWYGPAALMEIATLNKKATRQSIGGK